MFVYLGIIVAFSVLRGSNGQEACMTPSGVQGTCIGITQCTSLFNVLRKSESLPPSATDALRNLKCGVVGTIPKVCCPKNTQEVPATPPRSASQSGSPPDVSNHPKLGLINKGNCGPITETKIILGNKTTVLEFPWMALIGYKSDGQQGLDYQCGGTLINKRWILTAAHCVAGLRSDLKLAGIRLGEHDLSTERDCDREDGVPTVCADKYQDFSIENVITHDKYRINGRNDDIAMIKISKDADMKSTNVKPICLPVGQSATLQAKKAVVTGWGRYRVESGPRSQYLQKVALEITPPDQCARIFEPSDISITSKQLCAGGTDGKDSCAGDSGGPLQYPGKINGSPRYVQYGIVSFGTKSCGVKGYPGVYTKVSDYMDWILDNIDE